MGMDNRWELTVEAGAGGAWESNWAKIGTTVIGQQWKTEIIKIQFDLKVTHMFNIPDFQTLRATIYIVHNVSVLFLAKDDQLHFP